MTWRSPFQSRECRSFPGDRIFEATDPGPEHSAPRLRTLSRQFPATASRRRRPVAKSVARARAKFAGDDRWRVLGCQRNWQERQEAMPFGFPAVAATRQKNHGRNPRPRGNPAVCRRMTTGEMRRMLQNGAICVRHVAPQRQGKKREGRQRPCGGGKATLAQKIGSAPPDHELPPAAM